MNTNIWNCCVVVGDFQLKIKCRIFCCRKMFILHLLLLMIATKPSDCQPKQIKQLKQLIQFDHNNNNNNNKYNNHNDTNIVEINHIKLINDSFEVDHPTVTYKDDLVDENYVETSSKLSTTFYRLFPPEKIYFDIIPAESLELDESVSDHELLHMRLVPLSEDLSGSGNGQDAMADNKWRPKNYYSLKKLNKRRKRSTRNLNTQNIWDSLNPFLRYSIYPIYISDNQNSYVLGKAVYTKTPVAGKKHNALDIPVMPAVTDNPISFEGRVAADENDRVVFSSGSRVAAAPPVPTRRPPESLFRDPNPANFDFSFMNPANQNNNMNSQANMQSNNRLSVMSNLAASAPAPATKAPPPLMAPAAAGTLSQGVRPTVEPRRISQCVWAIVNCCSTTNNDIRYNCFERNGCYGAFWGLNPCADNIRENIVSYVAG